jgi:hypothetical protein
MTMWDHPEVQEGNSGSLNLVWDPIGQHEFHAPEASHPWHDRDLFFHKAQGKKEIPGKHGKHSKPTSNTFFSLSILATHPPNNVLFLVYL